MLISTIEQVSKKETRLYEEKESLYQIEKNTCSMLPTKATGGIKMKAPIPLKDKCSVWFECLKTFLNNLSFKDIYGFATFSLFPSHFYYKPGSYDIFTTSYL